MRIQYKKNKGCLLFVLFFVTTFSLKADMKIYSFLLNYLKKTHYSSAEYLAYKLLKEQPLKADVNYLMIPWPYLINHKRLHEVPRVKISGGFTICQSIYYEKIIPIVRDMGITIIFATHASKEKSYEGVIVVPFPHIAINGCAPAKHKDVYYSFMGAEWTHSVRKKIFQLPPRHDCIVKKRKTYHFGLSKQHQEQDRKEYVNVLARSRFSLCPRGTGPNSNRFWESLQAGAVPILISDDMTLPNGFDWDSCIVRILEKDVDRINDILSKISIEEENYMRTQCLEAYRLFSGKNFVNVIRNFYGEQ